MTNFLFLAEAAEAASGAAEEIINLGIISFEKDFFVEIVFTWINVGIVAFIVYSLLYKPIGNMLQRRQDKIASQIEEAEKKVKDATALQAEYEQKLKNIETEKAEILDSARQRGSERADQIIKEAQAEAQTIKSRAEADIQREMDKAQDEMKKQIIEVSSLMASKFVKNSMDDKSKASLLEASITELGDVKWPS